jgi:hypothetical protein
LHQANAREAGFSVASPNYSPFPLHAEREVDAEALVLVHPLDNLGILVVGDIEGVGDTEGQARILPQFIDI